MSFLSNLGKAFKTIGHVFAQAEAIAEQPLVAGLISATGPIGIAVLATAKAFKQWTWNAEVANPAPGQGPTKAAQVAQNFQDSIAAAVAVELALGYELGFDKAAVQEVITHQVNAYNEENLVVEAVKKVYASFSRVKIDTPVPVVTVK